MKNAVEILEKLNVIENDIKCESQYHKVNYHTSRNILSNRVYFNVMTSGEDVEFLHFCDLMLEDFKKDSSSIEGIWTLNKYSHDL